MKIKLYGTGVIESKQAFSSCALIDDKILFDCPNGLVKRLIQDGVNPKSIDVVIISHFHADHDFDIPFLLYMNKDRQDPLKIIAPKGAIERYKSMCDMANFPNIFKIGSPDILEVDNYKNGIDEIENYIIKPYKVKHFPTIECYGYTITSGDKTAAFTGDAVYCPGVEKLVSNANIAFLDITGPAILGLDPIHMDIPEFEQLKEKYPDCKMIPVHMKDETRKKLGKLGHKPPSDGKEFKI